MESPTTELTLSIRTGRDELRAGNTLAGTIDWRLNVQRPRITISYGWYAKGGAVFDFRCHAFQRIHDAERTGSREFAFPLPEGPLPFRGELFEVVWLVEALDERTGQIAQAEFTLLPRGATK